MSLFKKLMLLIVTLFSVCLLGTLYVTFQNSKVYYLEQLQANAQDSATSLGVSLSSHMNDKPYLLSMVDAVFDRGYFANISVLDDKAKVIIERKQKPNVGEIPAWFIKFVKFPEVEREALIIAGWKEIGKIKIISDPSSAYRDLWETTTELFLWFVILLMIFLSIAYMSLKVLLTPLYSAVNLARSICRSEFKTLTERPKTPELRMLIDALNKMVVKLKKIFEEHVNKIDSLQKEIFVDKLTGFGNRHYFEQKIRHILSDEESFVSGALLILEITNLKLINDKYGFETGDELILKTRATLEKYFVDENIYAKARITGGSFAVFVTGMNKSVIEDQLTKVLLKLKEVYQPVDPLVSAEIGFSFYHIQQSRSDLLSIVDKALSTAQSKGPFSWACESEESKFNRFSASEWRNLLRDAIDQNSFEYFSQPVYSKEEKVIHDEIYIRLKLADDKLLAAGEFIPMADKLLLTASIDRIVLQKAAQLIRENQKPYSLNLSGALVLSEDEQNLYLNTIIKTVSQTNLLYLEIAENLIKTYPKQSKKLIDQLTALGCQVGVDKLGGNLFSISYLSEFNVSFIKLDPSLTRLINLKPQKQEAIRVLLQAVRALEITVIATNVEQQDELAHLYEIGIDYAQGRYLGEPKVI